MSTVAMNWTGLIDALGGGRKVAQSLSTPAVEIKHDTVYSWSRTNRIPAWRQAPLLALAAVRGVRLSDYQHDGQADADAAAAAIRATRARSAA